MKIEWWNIAVTVIWMQMSFAVIMLGALIGKELFCGLSLIGWVGISMILLPIADDISGNVIFPPSCSFPSLSGMEGGKGH